MDYKQIAKEARLRVLELIYKAQTSHIGSNFSAIDIMAVLFSNINLGKDKFILSAGWKAASLYYFLYKLGRITDTELDSYCQEGSKFIGLAEPIHPDIPFAGGSIGMGLAAGVGLAYSKKLNKEKGNVYVLESDGGMQCGITWEALAFASQHNLNNLVLIVDRNNYQAMDKTDVILSQDKIAARCSAFGCHTRVVSGHNYEKLERAIFADTSIDSYETQPLVVIAKTIKGKGVGFMEANPILWHYLKISDKDYQKAKQELCK